MLGLQRQSVGATVPREDIWKLFCEERGGPAEQERRLRRVDGLFIFHVAWQAVHLKATAFPERPEEEVTTS